MPELDVSAGEKIQVKKLVEFIKYEFDNMNLNTKIMLYIELTRMMKPDELQKELKAKGEV